jgi:hypothetical protein
MMPSLVSYEMIEDGELRMVKLYAAGTSRAVIEKELEITELMKRYGLETPFIHGMVERQGRWGISYDKVLGPSYTQWMAEHPSVFNKLIDYFAHEHHEVHLHRVPELPRLKDVLAERIQEEDGFDSVEKESLMKRLDRLRDGNWLCHMNYVPDNIVISLDGPVVFNWEGAVRGDYLADVAMTSLRMEGWVPQIKEMEAAAQFRDSFRFGYIKEYMKISGRFDDELATWIELLRAVLP